MRYYIFFASYNSALLKKSPSLIQTGKFTLDTIFQKLYSIFFCITGIVALAAMPVIQNLTFPFTTSDERGAVWSRGADFRPSHTATQNTVTTAVAVFLLITTFKNGANN